MTDASINIGMRIWRSRVARTAANEAGGISLVAPAIAVSTDHSIKEGTL